MRIIRLRQVGNAVAKYLFFLAVTACSVLSGGILLVRSQFERDPFPRSVDIDQHHAHEIADLIHLSTDFTRKTMLTGIMKEMLAFDVLDGDGAVDKQLQQFDKEKRVGDTRDHGIKGFSEMLFHEDQFQAVRNFTFGTDGDPFAGRKEIAGLLEGQMFPAGCPFVVLLIDHPAYLAVDYQVGIPSDRRSEMGIVGGGKAEVAGVVRGVPRLLHGPQQEIVDDIFLRTAAAQVEDPGEPVRAVFHFRQLEPEGLGENAELLDLVRVRQFMNAVEAFPFLLGKGGGHRFIDRQHEFLDDLMGEIVFRPLDRPDPPVFFKFDVCLRQGEAEGTTVPPFLTQGPCQFAGPLERREKWFEGVAGLLVLIN